MDEEDPDWKPGKVKVEPELMLDANDGTDDYSSGYYLEDNHHVQSATLEEKSPVIPGRIDCSNVDGFSSTTSLGLSTSQDISMVKIKEERTEDETPSADFTDDDQQNSPAASFGERSTFHQGKIRVKTEDDLKEGLTEKAYQQEVFLEAREVMRDEGMSYSITDHSSYSASEGGASLNQKIKEEPEDYGAKTDVAVSPLRHSSNSNFMPTVENGTASYPFLAFTSSLPTLQNHTESSDEKPFSTKQYSAQVCIPSCADRMQYTFVNCLALGLVKEEVVTEPDFYVDEINPMQIPEATSVPSNERAMPFGSPVKIEGCLSSEPHSKSFSQVSGLHFRKSSCNENHSQTHSDERTLFCDECSAQFKQKHHLERHLLIHSNERAYACNQCSARFPRKSNLQTHLRSHSNERAFSCNQCPFRFKSNYSLKRHLQTHSGGRLIRYKQHSVQVQRRPRRDTVQYSLIQRSPPQLTLT